MAKDESSVKLNKSKDKSEKKKRKHVEDDGENHVSSKKSKSAPASDSQHNGINGEISKKDTDSHRQKKSSGSALVNGIQDTSTNGNIEATTASSKKKKKSKSSSKAILEDDALTASGKEGLDAMDLDSSIPPPASSQKSKSRSNGIGLDTPAKPKSKSELPTEDQPIPMKIDTEQPQPMVNPSETPYTEQTLQTILSTAISIPEQDTSKSPFIHQATQFYLPLSPITLSSALEGVCAEHLSPLLLKYYAPLHGVVLSYANPRFSRSNEDEDEEGSQPLAISVAEYAAPMVWVDVDILLFKPTRGHLVEGLIVLQTESHIGLQVYNLFSGRISRTRVPTDWRWDNGGKTSRRRARKGKLKGGRDEEGQATAQQQVDLEVDDVHDDMGHWIDGSGVKVDGVLKFWVWEVDIAVGGREAERNLPTIEGTLIEEDLVDDRDVNTVQQRRGTKEGKRKV